MTKIQIQILSLSAVSTVDVKEILEFVIKEKNMKIFNIKNV